MDKLKLQVYSETGRLRSVLLHRPARELDNMTPSIMNRLLFDDIPDSVQAGAEYDAYLDILRQADVNCVFVEDLLIEALEHSGEREAFLDRYLGFSSFNARQLESLKRYYLDFDLKTMVNELVAGLRKEEAPERQTERFEDIGGRENPLILDPLPNLYFTRDPFLVIGSGVAISNMFYSARQRETLFAQTIFGNHRQWKDKIRTYNQCNGDSHIEGGDILILNEEVVAIGLSQRTKKKAIKTLAESLFRDESEDLLRHVLAFRIPSTRAFMHLDTVFTMLDKDSFVVHSAIEDTLQVTDFSWKNGKLQSESVEGNLSDILRKYLRLDRVRLIRCGGGSAIDSEREQWNDGSNTLALAPGEVIVYDRNHVTNRILEEEGIRLHKLPSSEISRGRGGPHCMSMPLFRDR